MDRFISESADMLATSKMTIALTGAGISVESGIPPFRGKGGIWERYDPFEYAHIDSYRKHPEKVWQVFLTDLVQTLNRAKPNRGHKGLAQLEGLGQLNTVITQNVDGLHQAAGNTDVIEFHGNFAWHRCMSCGNRLETHDLDLSVLPPRCRCGGIFRPECIFFGELIPRNALERSHRLAMQCDVILVVGTSASVQPAAMIPEMAKSAGAKVIEINPERTPLTGRITDVFLQGSAGEMMTALVSALKAIG
ncbi:MAG: NAD-dependent deacylase [Pseudomonadota bacterium]